MSLDIVLQMPVPYRKMWVNMLIDKYEKQQKAQEGNKSGNDVEKLARMRENIFNMKNIHNENE
jgi:hypothetical protein